MGQTTEFAAGSWKVWQVANIKCLPLAVIR